MPRDPADCKAARPGAPPLRLLALAAACLAAPAHAATLDDLLAKGYTVAAATRLAGSFGGCVRQRQLRFADGSVFACAGTKAQTAYEPRIVILRLAGEPPSVVLAGSAVLAGQLLRLGVHGYPVPLRMNPDPLPERHGLPAATLQPLGPIPSINAVTARQNVPLPLQQPARPSTSTRPVR